MLASLAPRFRATTHVALAVAKNPALLRVVVAFFLFNAVEFGTWVAILLYAYAETGAASIGLVALAQLLPAAVAAPFIAALADRYPRSRVLVATYGVQAASLGAAAAGILLGAPPAAVYLAAAVTATAIGATRPTQGALLPSISRTPAELTAANGLAGTVEGLGLLLGPLGAAAILLIGTPGHVLVIGAAGCAVASALVFRLARPGGMPQSIDADAPSPGEVHEADHESMTAGLAALRRQPATRLVVGLLGLRMVTSGGMDVLFVLLALQLFRTGDSGAAVLNAALGAGTVLGGAATFSLVGRQRLAPAMAISAIVLGGGLAAVAAVTSAALAPLVIALAGIGFAAADVVGRIILQRVTRDDVLARVLGALEGVGLAGLSLGSVLVPVVATLFSPVAALYAVAALLPIGVAVAWRGLRRIDAETRVPVRTLALLRAAPVFAPLPPPQLEAVARRARWITLETGETVIREGDVGDAYYVLERGAVRITRAGTELRVSSERGDGFGEIALLYDVRRTATVTATESSVLVAIERADFLELLTGHEQSRHAAEHDARERSPQLGKA